MKKLIMFAFFALVAKSVMAMPESLPQLENQAAYASWALSQVGGGYAYVSGNFLYTNGVTTFNEVTNDDGYKAVLSELGSKVVAFKPADPEHDDVYSVVVLRDRSWHTLFTGVHWYRMEKNAQGKWVAPADAGLVQIDHLNYWQYIYVGNDVDSARMDLRNEFGQQIGSENIQVEDGWIMFNITMAGGGNLILGNQYGETGYNLRDGGRKIESDLVSTNIVGDISTFVTNVAETVGHYTLQPESHHGYGHAKLIEMTVSSYRSIYFSGLTTEGEWADKVTVEDATTGEILQEIPMDAGRPARIELKPHGYSVPRTYHIHFRWENGFDEFRPQDYYGNGPG